MQSSYSKVREWTSSWVKKRAKKVVTIFIFDFFAVLFAIFLSCWLSSSSLFEITSSPPPPFFYLDVFCRVRYTYNSSNNESRIEQNKNHVQITTRVFWIVPFHLKSMTVTMMMIMRALCITVLCIICTVMNRAQIMNKNGDQSYR